MSEIDAQIGFLSEPGPMDEGGPSAEATEQGLVVLEQDRSIVLAHRRLGVVDSESAARCAACGTEQPCETLKALAARCNKSPVWDATRGR